MLTGSPIELCVYEPCACEDSFDLIAPLSELLILDSSHFFKDVAFLRHVTSRYRKIVDLEWIGQGLWREQVKLVFSRPTVCALLPHLQEIRLKGLGASGKVSAALMAGWLLDRLSARNLRPGAQGLLFDLAEQAGVRLDLGLDVDAKENGLGELSFAFKTPDRLRLDEHPLVSIKRGQELETVVRAETTDRTSVALEDQSWLGRLSRYYGVGEATTNYCASLERAISLLELTQG